MNLFKMIGRKPKVPETVVPAQPGESPLPPAAHQRQPPPPPPKPKRARHSALVLVDDDFLHRQLDELFQSASDEWDCERAGTVACARQLTHDRKFSVFISTATIENSSVVPLLNELHARHPGTLRYIYGTAPAEAEIKQLTGIRPALINTKSRKEMILAQLERELVVDSWLASSDTRQLMARFRHLPSIPTIYNQVIAELESPAGSFDAVAHLIAQDPLMTAKILQVVNSAIFALSSPVTKAEEAVLILGTQRTRALVLAVPVFTRFESGVCRSVSPEQVWQHSMEVAAAARQIALRTGAGAGVADAAFTAGLLHDVGKLLLAANLPDQYEAALQYCAANNADLLHVERRQLGTTHGEAAACLFGMWGLPLPVLEAIAHHHQPGRSEEAQFTPLTAVHAANTFFYERRVAAEPRLDAQYLERLGLLDSRNEWRLACGLPARAEDASLADKIRERQSARTN